MWQQAEEEATDDHDDGIGDLQALGEDRQRRDEEKKEQ